MSEHGINAVGGPMIQAILSENLSKIAKNQKSKPIKTTASISKSTNDLSSSNAPASIKASSSYIPLDTNNNLLNKSKSKSVSSLKKMQETDLNNSNSHSKKSKEPIKKNSSPKRLQTAL